MRIKYFPDTDTAHIEFANKKVQETKEISENIHIDIDKNGDLVNMTIEHAKDRNGLSEFSFQEIKNKVAWILRWHCGIYLTACLTAYPLRGSSTWQHLRPTLRFGLRLTLHFSLKFTIMGITHPPYSFISFRKQIILYWHR